MSERLRRLWEEHHFAVAVVAIVIVVAGVAAWTGLRISGWWDSRNDSSQQDSSHHDDHTSPPTTSPPPTEPPIPKAAQQNTLDGAKAFVVYYNDIVNYSEKVQNTARLRELFNHDTCRPCLGLADLIDERAKKGFHLSGGEYEVLNAIASPTQRGYFVHFHISQKPGIVLDKNGKVINPKDDQKGDELDITALVIWTDNRWLIEIWDVME